MAAVLRRLARAERIRSIAASAFETVPDRKQMVRRLLVYQLVADTLAEEVNPPLCREVMTAVRELGWRPLRPQNRRMFACVRPRN